MNRSGPRFSWMPIIFHFVAANALSWVFQASHDFSIALAQVAEAFSFVIPSISGYSAMSSNPQWASCYLVACWLGAPFYIWFSWRLAGAVLPAWVAVQTASRFWLVSMINLTCAVTLIVLPLKRTHITDASESVRTVAAVASLMRDYPIVFSIVIMAVVCTFSFISAATVKSIVLRFAATASNNSAGRK